MSDSHDGIKDDTEIVGCCGRGCHGDGGGGCIKDATEVVDGGSGF